MATLVKTPVYTASQFSEAEFKLTQVADPYALKWLFNHARIAPSSGGPNGALNGDEKPLIYFPTGEYDEPESGAHVVPNKRIEFENTMSPLRIKGDIVNNQLVAEVGLNLNPAVYYKLGDLNGDLSKGPVSFEIPDTTLYKGTITIHPPPPGSNGLGGFFAKVDWVGLGIKVANAVIPLLK